MSALVSAARLPRSLQPRPRPCFRRGLAAHAVGHDDHTHGAHEHEHDDTYNTKESFTSPFWRRTAVVTVAAILFSKYGPAPGDDSRITRWIASISPDPQRWADINLHHTLLAQDVSEASILFQDAKKSRTHRFRYPLRMELASSHRERVGTSVDFSGVVVKGDRDP